MILHKGDIIKSDDGCGLIVHIKINKNGTSECYNGTIVRILKDDDGDVEIGEDIDQAEEETVTIVKRCAQPKPKNYSFKAKNKSKMDTTIRKIM